MNINIPELSLVVLIGTSGPGKSTFAKRHFLATEAGAATQTGVFRRNGRE